MAATKTAAKCGRCGADAFGARGSERPYLHRLRVRGGERGSSDAVLHLCSACTREFASDRERDAYLESGLLV